MFKFITDQAAVLGVEAIVRVDMLLLRTGEHRHFGGHFFVAVGSVHVGHPDILRFCGVLCRAGVLLCIHAVACIYNRVSVRLTDRPVLRLAFLITAHQHFGVAIRRVGVFLLPALVIDRFCNAAAVQLPVDK